MIFIALVATMPSIARAGDSIVLNDIPASKIRDTRSHESIQFKVQLFEDIERLKTYNIENAPNKVEMERYTAYAKDSDVHNLEILKNYLTSNLIALKLKTPNLDVGGVLDLIEPQLLKTLNEYIQGHNSYRVQLGLEPIKPLLEYHESSFESKVNEFKQKIKEANPRMDEFLKLQDMMNEYNAVQRELKKPLFKHDRLYYHSIYEHLFNERNEMLQAIETHKSKKLYALTTFVKSFGQADIPTNYKKLVELAVIISQRNPSAKITSLLNIPEFKAQWSELSSLRSGVLEHNKLLLRAGKQPLDFSIKTSTSLDIQVQEESAKLLKSKQELYAEINSINVETAQQRSLQSTLKLLAHDPIVSDIMILSRYLDAYGMLPDHEKLTKEQLIEYRDRLIYRAVIKKANNLRDFEYHTNKDIINGIISQEWSAVGEMIKLYSKFNKIEKRMGFDRSFVRLRESRLSTENDIPQQLKDNKERLEAELKAFKQDLDGKRGLMDKVLNWKLRRDIKYFEKDTAYERLKRKIKILLDRVRRKWLTRRIEKWDKKRSEEVKKALGVDELVIKTDKSGSISDLWDKGRIAKSHFKQSLDAAKKAAAEIEAQKRLGMLEHPKPESLEPVRQGTTGLNSQRRLIV